MVGISKIIKIQDQQLLAKKSNVETNGELMEIVKQYKNFFHC